MNKISGISVLLWSTKTLFLRNKMSLTVILFFATTNVVSALTFSNIEVTAIRNNSVVIRWDTDTTSTGQIEYGTTASYGDTSKEKGLSHWQQIEITGLTEGTEYHFRIRAIDYKGNETASEDSVFTTRTQTKLDSIIRAARTLGDLPKVYYMKPAGNDSLSGLSIDSAWATLSYAQYQLQPGDTLLIADGTYYNDTFLGQISGIPEAPITIKAYDGTPTFITNNILDSLNLFRFHDWGDPGPISYYKFDGITATNYSKAFEVWRDAEGFSITNITTYNCSFLIHALRNCSYMTIKDCDAYESRYAPYLLLV